MTSESARLADELNFAFEGPAWFGDSLLEILQGVTAEQAAKHPIAGAHSIWELVLHTAAWEQAVRKRMTGVAIMLEGADNFPRVTDTTEAAWQRALQELRSAHEDLVEAARKFPEESWRKQVPGKSGAHYDFAYMLHGIAQHAAYHGAQIALLKKM